MADKFKKGDSVIVVAGNSKGISGPILKIKYDRSENDKRRVVKKVLIDGVNTRVRSKRRTRDISEIGVKYPNFIDVSNVMHLDPKLLVPTRVGFKILNDKKVRYCKKSNEIIDI